MQGDTVKELIRRLNIQREKFEQLESDYEFKNKGTIYNTRKAIISKAINQLISKLTFLGLGELRKYTFYKGNIKVYIWYSSTIDPDSAKFLTSLRYPDMGDFKFDETVLVVGEAFVE